MDRFTEQVVVKKNRTLDEIVYFNHLTEENIRAITELMLNDLKAVMSERGMTLHWDSAVADYLASKGFSNAYGARNLQRLIQKEVEDSIAVEIVDRKRGSVSQVKLSMEEGKIAVYAL